MGNQIKKVAPHVDEGYYIKTTGYSFNEFIDQCSQVGRDYAKFDSIMSKYMSIHEFKRSMFRDIFVTYISYAVPTPQVISLIYEAYSEHLKLYPSAKLVDLGTGSGVFPWLLERQGISKDKIIAVDVPAEKKTNQCLSLFWDNIIEDDNYKVDKDDIILIAWGYGRYSALDQYIISGGKCVVIIGENQEGCTLPAELFSLDWGSYNAHEINLEEFGVLSELLKPDSERRGLIPSEDLQKSIKGWKVKTYEVMGGANMITPDSLTVNTRY